MSNFKVEKNVPITKTKKVNDKYPFSEMEVGDSFFIKCKDKEDFRRKSIVVCNYFKKYILDNNLNWKYCTRKQEDYNIRVWRTS